MLYLVSGASRSGKTLIAKRILDQRQVPYLSLDWLVMGFTNGLPKIGIHDKLFPDEIAEKLWTFLQAMCDNMLWSGVDYVIEGEAVLPGSARTLLDKYPESIRACFVGYADADVDEKIRDVKAYSDGQGDWLNNEPDETIRRHFDNMVAYSRKVKAECKKHNVRYFDTSNHFVESIDSATDYLLRVPE